MNPPAHERRAAGAEKTPLQHAKEWAPAAIGLLVALGGQLVTPGDRLVSIEHEQSVNRMRDSLSVADRTAFAEALSTLGRIQCRIIGADKITDFGVPCRVLLDGGRWPLLHGGARAAASSTAILPLAPLPVTPEAALLAALLLPAVPAPWVGLP